jgi:hypothetical protein
VYLLISSAFRSLKLAKQEQGAIEPLLLLGPGIETVLEGREHVRGTRKMRSYLTTHVRAITLAFISPVNGMGFLARKR